MKCVDCKTADATHYPKIMVPAVGYALETHQPLGAVMSVPLCLECCKKFHVKETLEIDDNNSLRNIFNIASRGKADPDFDRAFVQPIPLTCEEAMVLTNAMMERHAANTNRS